MVFLLAPFLLVFSVFFGRSDIVCGASDICDWVGSGLYTGVPRGVQPLYLRCIQGRIKWHYPRGALRVLLTPPLERFQGCVRIASRSAGARLYLEGEKRLYQLYQPGDGKAEELLRCFTSRKGQVALYVEADAPVMDPLRKDVVEFSYDLVSQEDLANDMEECRPCTEEYMLHKYCTSDFVVQGPVTSLTHNETTQQSELTVLAKKIKRESPTIRWRGEKYLTLYRPLKCGTKVGNGDFVFFGRYRLGFPTVVCAPRLAHWKEIRKKALVQQIQLCELD